MRSPLTVTTFILLVIVAGVFYIAHGFHEAKLERVAKMRAVHYAAIAEQCGRFYPRSEDRQRECVHGIMGERK